MCVYICMYVYIYIYIYICMYICIGRPGGRAAQRALGKGQMGSALLGSLRCVLLLLFVVIFKQQHISFSFYVY